MSLTSKSVLSSTITHTVLVSIAGVHQSKSSRVTSRTLLLPSIDSFLSWSDQSFTYLFTYTFLLFKVGIFGYLWNIFVHFFFRKKTKEKSPKRSHPHLSPLHTFESLNVRLFLFLWKTKRSLDVESKTILLRHDKVKHKNTRIHVARASRKRRRDGHVSRPLRRGGCGARFFCCGQSFFFCLRRRRRLSLSLFSLSPLSLSLFDE